MGRSGCIVGVQLLNRQGSPIMSAMSNMVSSSSVSVHLLPDLVHPDELRGGCAIVLDVLRATTTIGHALAAGATCVIPCGEVNEARRRAGEWPRGEVVLGGERKGVLIEGFDLGNTPTEYTAERVAGKKVIFTTTNGTRALLRCQQAEHIVCGAFANLQALLAWWVTRCGGANRRPLHVVCAGTDGAVTGEDVLCAGALVQGVRQISAVRPVENDAAAMAAEWFLARSVDEPTFLQTMLTSHGGKNLCDIGLGQDVETSARWNTLSLLPEYDPARGIIQAATDVEPIQSHLLRSW